MLEKVALKAPVLKWVIKDRKYSHCAEDALLNRIFNNVDLSANFVGKKGFYLDIGAHHPIDGSNTLFFYQNGWSGINVEANPNAQRVFQSMRPKDINLNYAICGQEGSVEFFLFGEQNAEYFGSSSTTSAEFRDHMENTQNRKANVLRVPATTMEKLLDQYLNDREIDFMSLDIEGGELEALQSNNWSRYRPLIIAVEILELFQKPVAEYAENPIIQFLESQGYQFLSQTLFTFFFYDTKTTRTDVLHGWFG